MDNFTFWIVMLIMLILLPSTMLCFGVVFRSQIPEFGNDMIGYRTKRSKSSREAWQFAHTAMGKLWTIVGPVLLVVTIIPFVFIMGESISQVGYFALGILLVQVVVMSVTTYAVEVKLKKNFDEDGKKIVE